MSDDLETLVGSGDFVFREGDEGGELYVIEEGQVELVAGPAHTRVALLDVGDFFGERSVLEDAPREVSARAVTECRLLRLDRVSFHEIVARSPEVALLMARHLSRRAVAAPTPAMSAVLVHETSGTRFPLRAESTVGRVSRTTGAAPDVDLTALDSDKMLSRRHARIAMRPEGFYLREDEGRNGTFVNGERLGSGVEVRLSHGDRIRFGPVEVVIRLS
ncbi:MAG: cyclic nucleotide-binding domain-containing protein [Vicinamibacteraceae bacterium]